MTTKGRGGAVDGARMTGRGDEAESADDRAALRALAAPGAFLLVCDESGRAGVFAPSNRFKRPLAAAPAATAERWRAQGVIVAQSSSGAAAGRRRRYMLAPERRRDPVQPPKLIDAARRNQRESPLAWLARRRDAQGRVFLSAAEVDAGERLRADFEAASLGPRVGQDWSRFLAPVDEPARVSGGPVGAAAPRARVRAALDALGPGLDDVALRVCCFLEGLEALERAEGWASRSGKVVLKIALGRLARHYGLDLAGPESRRIGVWRAEDDA